MTDASVRRTRQTPSERRDGLLSAARRAIRAHGFDAVTVRDVAREAGVSVGLVHHYFETFPDLLAAAFEQAAVRDIERLGETIGAVEGAVARLNQLLVLYAPRRDEPSWLIWIDAWGAAPRQPALRATAARLTIAWVETMTAVLDDGVLEGAFRCADPRASGWRLIALIDGLAAQVVAVQALDYEEMRALAAVAAEHEAGIAAGSLPWGRS